MALTLRPAVAHPQPHRLRRAATAPVPVLLVASALTTGLLVVLADLVAKLG
jgi:hypothetical protein